jgi:poly(A) polymerase
MAPSFQGNWIRDKSPQMADENESRAVPLIDGSSAPELGKANWLQAHSCQAVFQALESGGYEGRAVGGAVRNSLMGHQVTDIDIATPALPDEVTRLCQAAGLSVHPTGLGHGTVTVVSNHVPYEVTTLRQDVETHGRHATVSFTRDWRADASRRDFTMNALYCDRRGVLSDPLGGLPDLLARRVRFIGEARDRIREDFLRILRFFRFFATYGQGRIDGEGLSASAAEKDGLKDLSAERIQGELLKLVVAGRAHEALCLMSANGITELVLGRDGDLARFDKLSELETKLGSGPDPILRLSALAAPDEVAARELALRLRLSNAERKELVTVSGVSASEFTPDSETSKVQLYRLGEPTYQAVCLSAWTRSKDDASSEVWRKAFALPERWKPPVMPFKGADLISRGVRPGPEVGAVLSRFESWWVSAGFPHDRSLLEAKLKELAGL